jgi:tRNA threonylcarbamoyladenosine biosynthesis protein TsaE
MMTMRSNMPYPEKPLSGRGNMSDAPPGINGKSPLPGRRLPGLQVPRMDEDSQAFGRELMLHGPADTEALGARIAAGLRVGTAVALEGDLGAGKTVLARAILRALGVEEDVPSPTFTLVQSYETRKLPVRHYDLYRIENASEMEELGLEEALDEGAALIEWPERAANYIPEDALYVRMEVTGENSRRAYLSGPSHWAHEIGKNGS